MAVMAPDHCNGCDEREKWLAGHRRFNGLRHVRRLQNFTRYLVSIARFVQRRFREVDGMGTAYCFDCEQYALEKRMLQS